AGQQRIYYTGFAPAGSSIPAPAPILSNDQNNPTVKVQQGDPYTVEHDIFETITEDTDYYYTYPEKSVSPAQTNTSGDVRTTKFPPNPVVSEPESNPKGGNTPSGNLNPIGQ